MTDLDPNDSIISSSAEKRLGADTVIFSQSAEEKKRLGM